MDLVQVLVVKLEICGSVLEIVTFGSSHAQEGLGAVCDGLGVLSMKPIAEAGDFFGLCGQNWHGRPRRRRVKGLDAY